MKKYVITKSFTRIERCNLFKKLYEELLNDGKFNVVAPALIRDIKDKKKKRLYGNKKGGGVIHSIELINYKGIRIYLIMSSNMGYDIVFNTSPIDVGYVEYIRVSPSGTPIVYTQHLLDRYNQRVYDRKFTTHKDMMVQLILANARKSHPSTNEDGSAVQRINEGFLLGVFDGVNECVIYNTFYDSEEYKDNEIKGGARSNKNHSEGLTEKESLEYDKLQKQHAMGEISLEDFSFIIKLKGYV